MKNLAIINEITFLREENQTGLLHYKYPAKLTVKLGNLVDELTIKMLSNDLEDKQNEIIIHTDKLTPIMEAGLEIDFSEIKNIYQNQLVREIEIDKELKMEAKLKKYKNSWVHDAMKEIKNFSFGGLNFEIDKTWDEYKESSYLGDLQINLTYKNVKGYISKESTRSGIKFNLQSNIIASYSGRNYKILKSLVKKFIELTEEAILRTENKKNAEIKKEILKAETAKKYSLMFGECIAVEKYISSEHRYGGGYYVTRYEIPLKGHNYNISEYKEKYSFAGLKDLSKEQVRDIIKIINK